MPNMHADHYRKTNEKCQFGSPIIQVCKSQLWMERLMIVTIGFIVGVVFHVYFGR